MRGRLRHAQPLGAELFSLCGKRAQLGEAEGETRASQAVEMSLELAKRFALGRRLLHGEQCVTQALYPRVRAIDEFRNQRVELFFPGQLRHEPRILRAFPG